MSSTPINKHLRGIRDSIPGGYILGRTGKGNGPPILLPLSTFTTPGYVANTTIQVGQTAGGDLSGTYPNPSVVKLQGNAVKNVAPTDGQILEWVNANSNWEPVTPTANPSATAGSTAINGTAKTFMRSDAAPAVAVATVGNLGLVKPDGTTITISAGVISSTGGGSATGPGLDKVIDRFPLDLKYGGGAGGTPVGYPPGTVPTVVQVAFSVAGGNSATFSAPPTNGNYLVAMSFNPTSSSVGAGWTRQVLNSTGTDFGQILTKAAGAAESATQTPCSGIGATGAIIIWEIHGQSGSVPFIGGLSQTEQTGTSSTPVLLPSAPNCLGLSAIGVVTTPTITAAVNVGVQDVLDNSNSRKLVAGHSDASKTAQTGIFAAFSASAGSKAATCLISS